MDYKTALAERLPIDRRAEFLASCAAIEKRYTEECRAKNDPCLASGCSMDVDDTCLEPLLEHEADYRQACEAEWAKLAHGR